jgi:hypothetical protein
MNSREMWENQILLLTRHCQTLTRQVDELESRLHYYEGVVATLLVALKENGVLVPQEQSDPNEKTYEF